MKLTLSEYRDMKIKKINDEYDAMEPYNVTYYEMFKGYWRISPETFPYALATEIKIRTEGIGNSLYELTFRVHQPIKIYICIEVDDEADHERIVHIMNKQPLKARKRVSLATSKALTKHIRDETSYVEKRSKEYQAWYLSNPIITKKTEMLMNLADSMKEAK